MLQFLVLQVTREASKSEIKRSFRLLASKTHPDKFQSPEDKEVAQEKFLKLQTA